MIYLINPPFSTHREIPNAVVAIRLVFGAQSITLDRPLLRKKRAVKIRLEIRPLTGRDLSN